jgi:hypothetical protein
VVNKSLANLDFLSLTFHYQRSFISGLIKQRIKFIFEKTLQNAIGKIRNNNNLRITNAAKTFNKQKIYLSVRQIDWCRFIQISNNFYINYTVKTNFISTCEISEKARDGKISFAETEKIFFSYNPHEHFFIFFAGKFSCGL